MKKGKRGGFRTIYYVELKDRVVMLTMYAKSEHDSITAAEIRSLIEEHERMSE